MFKLLFYNYYVIILYIPMSLSNFIPDDGSLWSIRAVDISGNYNQKLSLDASGNAIIITGNTNRLTINSSGAWTCQGGMTYNNSTNTLTAGTFSGTATTATNIAGGIASQIPYQTAPSTTAFIPNGTAGQVLTSNGTSVPTWVSKAFVYTTGPAGAIGKTYAASSVLFGGLVAPFLSVNTTAGLTNTGTNGWVRTATVGAEGRFYSPTTSQWLVNLVVQYTSATAVAIIDLSVYNSLNALQYFRTAVHSFVAGNFVIEYTCILEMNAGDYFQFTTANAIDITYLGQARTTLQVREL